MATTTWSVFIDGVNFSTHVLSLNFDLGRRTIFDEFNGGNISLTLRNNTNQCGAIVQNATISLDNNQQYFFVTGIQFDEGITDAEATCTLTGIDYFAQLAQYPYGVGAGGSSAPLTKMWETWTSSGYAPPYMDSPLPSRSVISTIGPSSETTFGNWFSVLINGEMGSLVSTAGTIYPIPNGYFPSSWLTFGRSDTAGIPYSNLSRIVGTDIAANNVTIDYISSAATYLKPGAAWKRSYTRYTTLTAGIATDQAQFFARALTDPDTISGSLTWTDKAATTGNNGTFMSSFAFAPAYMATLEYKLPGGSATSKRIKIEGVTCNAIPGQTTWTVDFTDGSLYDGFQLNTNTAILGLARFGW
jgi:hypothetical protein